VSTVNELIEKLGRRLSFEELLAIWHEYEQTKWAASPEIHLRLGKAFLGKGENLFALDVFNAGIRISSLRGIRQQQAVAFARTGALDRARNILESLLKEDRSDGETLGILARTYKDSWRLTGDRVDLQMARDLYRDAYEKATARTPPDRDGVIYSGINAATTSFLLDELAEMKSIASATRMLCHEILRANPDTEDYWVVATLGEAALLLGDFEDARRHYAHAACICQGNTGHLATTRRQAREILRHRGDPRTLDDCLPIGPVIVFAGHMVDIDTPAGRPPRFPAGNESAVAEALSRKISELAPEISYSSAAFGSDILFLEAIRRVGRSATVVLPFGRTEFRDTSVTAGGAEWGERYDNLLNAVGEARIREVSKTPLEFASASYDYANMVLQGMATIAADELDTELVGVAVWDGQAGHGPGGTASIATRWIAAGMRVELIDPNGRDYKLYQIPPPIGCEGDTRIVSVLFADVVHFSLLTEEELPSFGKHFLPLVAKVVRECGEPLLKNTWGDGLFMAFDDSRQAGRLALALQSAIAGQDWSKCGLPPKLNLRISLHAGPAYECTNPVTGRRDFLGYHVSRGARIEPVTDTGQVWCSREFTAMVRAQAIAEFEFEYVGQIELPKESGVIPLYNLRSNVSGRAARTV
jgi:class 3 adenylate cyclase/tetratricopeptide (TPR) repeat protein